MARLIKYSPTSKGTMVPDRKGNWYFVEEVAPLLAVEKLTTTNNAMVPLLRECRAQLCKLQGHGNLTSRIDVALSQQHQ